MSLMVRGFPVLPGQEDAARQFVAELTGPRQHEVSDFFRRFGICRESWHLQHLPHAALIIVVSELTDKPEVAARDYAESQHPFDRWFKSQVCQLCGVDPDEAPLGPLTETSLNWDGR